MRKLASIFLIFGILALASGAVEYAHNAQHAHDDALRAAADRESGGPVDEQPVHDDSNCDTHAQLHQPFTGAGFVQLLVFFGLFVAFLTQIARPLIARAPAFRLDCRGPPACSLIAASF